MDVLPFRSAFSLFCIFFAENNSSCTVRENIYGKCLSIEKNNNNKRKIMRDIVEICKSK